jgi:hypothetical protein
LRICRGYIYRLYYLTGEGEEESGGEVHDDRSPPMVTEETAGALCDGAVESSSEVPPSMPAAKGKRGGKGRMVVEYVGDPPHEDEGDGHVEEFICLMPTNIPTQFVCGLLCSARIRPSVPP